ncbi:MULTISPECIES: glycosyltransferase family 2 protein [Bacillus]|uniref:Glycosyltransferase 2-like domain-containing protein n=1 Tax=Bacillus cereus TaxID=1396 RepID=A0A9X6GDE4_BACCE|nr:glycosyltransferase family A protein [Bacillus cereus]OOR72374.1 hypothetical protein BLX06_25150 [Bacillus cereus]
MEKPLVSVLIPAIGNPHYVELALTSVLLQTYTNIEIIIRDPSTTDTIQILLEKEFLPYSNKITYIRDSKYMSRLNILQELLKVSKGEYVTFLMEEDLLYPSKIEKMMNYFLRDNTNSIKLVTSYTEPIDIQGNILPVVNSITKNHASDVQWDSTIGSHFILKYKDYVGGLSAPLFRKQDLIQPFGQFAGHQFIKDVEIASWLTLLTQGSLVVIIDELTFERKNIDNQKYKIDIDLITDWISIIKLIKNSSNIHTKNIERIIVQKLLGWLSNLLANKQNIFSLMEQEKMNSYKNYLYELQT